MPEHNYVNDSVIAANRDNHRDPASLFDVFDMRKNHLYYLLLLMKIHNVSRQVMKFSQNNIDPLQVPDLYNFSFLYRRHTY